MLRDRSHYVLSDRQADDLVDKIPRLAPAQTAGIDRGCGKTSLWPSVFFGAAAFAGPVGTG